MIRLSESLGENQKDSEGESLRIMEIPSQKTSPLVEENFDYTGANSPQTWENIFGPTQQSFLSPSGGTMVLDKTGPYGIGGMTFSTKLDRNGLGAESRSWLTLDTEAREEERQAIKASFQEGLENWEGEDHILYAAWNYTDAPSLSGPHRHAQSIMTHHTHVGRINRRNMQNMGVLKEPEENHKIRRAILTDADVNNVLAQAPYDCSDIKLQCLSALESGNSVLGIIPETGFPKGALRFSVPKGLDVFDDKAVEEDIEALITHIDTVHKMVVARAKQSQAFLNGSQNTWDQNPAVYSDMVDAVVSGEKRKYPVILGGEEKDLKLPLKDFTTYTMGFYMVGGELFFFVAPSFFSGGGSIEKMGIELRRKENPEAHEALLSESRRYMKGIAERLDWVLRPESFKGYYKK